MATGLALRSVKLVNYKGFENHTISLRGTNVLIGANNAGKSTALGALRLIAAMIPVARRTRPLTVGRVEDRPVRGWPITAKAIETSAFSNDNIRFDFRPGETRIEVTATSGARMVASWASIQDPEDSSTPGVFSVFPPKDSNPAPRTIAQTLVPTVAVVPTLTPLDQHEASVGEETIYRHLSGRRSSRYFRNALALLTEAEWTEFRSFVYERTPELSNLALVRSFGSKDDVFDLFYEEEGTRHEREIGWAGDGIQIWLQCLYHLWRQRDAEVVILDEPDVFLHPDLQRRLARTIFAADRQTILATHSVEILAECEPGSAVWIDRSRRSAERPRADGALALLGRRLGSGYELGVGRALRSRTVLFVEGDDAPVLALLALAAGKTAVASSKNYATVPLGGFSRNWRAGAFAETMATLGGDLRTFVILDGDLRSPAAVESETAQIKKSKAAVHVWRRREIENYLLVPAAVAKAAGVPQARAETLLSSAIEEHRDEAAIALQNQRLEERRLKIGDAGKLSNKTVLERAMAEFSSIWDAPGRRVEIVDAKLVISSLNRDLQAAGKKTINSHSLARAMPAAEMPTEMITALDEFDALIARP